MEKTPAELEAEREAAKVVPGTTSTPRGEVPEGHVVVPLEVTEVILPDMPPKDEEPSA